MLDPPQALALLPEKNLFRQFFPSITASFLGFSQVLLPYRPGGHQYLVVRFLIFFREPSLGSKVSSRNTGWEQLFGFASSKNLDSHLLGTWVNITPRSWFSFLFTFSMKNVMIHLFVLFCFVSLSWFCENTQFRKHLKILMLKRYP